MLEGCLCDAVSRLPHLNRSQVLQVLQGESKDLEITKSLLNLLHNIVRVGSVPVTKAQKDFFDSHAQLVLGLLNATKPLKWKKAALEANLPLVVNIAASCPTAAGL